MVTIIAAAVAVAAAVVVVSVGIRVLSSGSGNVAFRNVSFVHFLDDDVP